MPPQQPNRDFLSDAHPANDFLADAVSTSAPAPAKKPLPELPQDLTGVAANAIYGDFFPQVGAAAKKNVSDAWSGIRKNVSDAIHQLAEDPSRIAPMWFGGLMGALGAAGKTVATPISYLAQGDLSAALSSAAGGDPEAARRYAEEGNAGGEFWEMAGKPLLLLATGEAAGRAGLLGPRVGPLEDTVTSRLRVVRGIMADGARQQTGIDLADAQLGQQALQDAAREVYGVGKAGRKALRKAAPAADFSPEKLGVENGNKAVVELARKAVEIAGKPADLVNQTYGYLPGQQIAQAIRSDLLTKAAEAEKNGLTTYARALTDRANAMNHARTLGDIYKIKVSANHLSDVARNTQEAIDMMDSWSELASSIRRNLYPVYQKLVGPDSGFNLVEAGRKEGAAIALRNGVERRWAEAQAQTDALHTPGGTMRAASHGYSPKHTVLRQAIRAGQQMGFLPSPQGDLNRTMRKAVGELSPGTRPESLTVVRPSRFEPASSRLPAFPGGTISFEIPGDFPGRETIRTSDPEVARSALRNLETVIDSPEFAGMPFEQQKRLYDAQAKLSDQLRAYDTSTVSHPPAQLKFTPRVTGKLPAPRRIAKKLIPAETSSYEREQQQRGWTGEP